MSSPKKSVVFTYGRFNPPHLGHKFMIQEIIDRARAEKKKPVIIVSHSTGTANNPLNVDNKLKILKGWFPNVTFMQSSPQISLAKISNGFSNNSIMIVGQNRKNSFGYMKFNKGSISRKPGAPSATKARAAAVRGNVKTFKNLTGYNSPKIINIIKTVSQTPATKKRKATPATKKRTPPKKRKVSPNAPNISSFQNKLA
jgi:hypothetical protein